MAEKNLEERRGNPNERKNRGVGKSPISSARRFFFLWKGMLMARKSRLGRVCAENYRPSYCGFRVSDFFWFSFSIRNPQSAFRNCLGG